MANISQEYFNKYRYSIRGPLGAIYISQPVGWNDDEKVFKRSKDTHGVFINLSNNLEFYVGDEYNDGGYNYLKETYRTYGINSIVSLVKEEDVSGIWVESYRGYFDFSTYIQAPYKITIKFNESGLYEKIKARQDEDLELDRLTTMDGTVIPEMKTEIVGLDGRKILIIDELKVTTMDPPINLPITNNDGDIYIDTVSSWVTLKWGGDREYNAAVIPVKMIAEQAGNVQTVSDYKCGMHDTNGNYENASSTANMFYDEIPNNNTIKLDINIDVTREGPYDVQKLTIDLVKYGGYLGLEYISHERLISVDNPVENQIHSYVAVGKLVPLLTGESLCITCRGERSNHRYNTSFHFTKMDIKVYDETYADPSQAKFVMPFVALDRILNIITNRSSRLISNALSRKGDAGYAGADGFAALTGLTNGFWVREFNTSMITTSYKDFVESFMAVWQLGYGIEKIGFDEHVRVEHIKHFYQEVVTIRLNGQPNNIVRKCAPDYFSSSLNIGYSQPSGTILYEEVLGLDEYNIQNTYTTPITRIEKKTQNISKYRADSYGTEFARRKPKAKYPEEDTRYDLNVMVLDLKDGEGGIFKQRKWADDFIVPTPFSKETTGIYSPETATNLRFSPMNVLKRMGYWIKGGFMKNLTEYVRYSSSNGNSALITESNVPGSFETAENGNVLCYDLDKNLFNPDIIEFEFPVNTKLMQTVNGTTVVNGETIMNYYGLVEFINEDGDYEYGFLLTLEPNNEGRWELLSSTKRISSVSLGTSVSGVIVPPKDLTALDITP